jgi:hypothetical protein
VRSKRTRAVGSATTARVFDEHPTLAEALEHLRAIAADQPEAAQVFVHTLDGQVRWEGAT